MSLNKKLLLSLAALMMIGCTPKQDPSQGSSSATPEPTPEVTPEVTPEPTEEPEQTPEPEVTPEAEETGFRTGVWAADDGEELTRYFIFDTEKMEGTEIDAELGKRIDFTCDASEDRISFNYGGDSDVTAEMEAKEDGTIVLRWAYGTEETLTYVTDAINMFRFYSTREIGMMALDYYELHNDYRPAYASWVSNPDGTVSVQLYDVVDDHNSTSAWYTVDRFTGIGKDDMTGEEVNLAEEG